MLKQMLLLAVVAACGCSASGPDYGAQVADEMRDSIGSDLANLIAFAQQLQAAAPAHAWDATADANAISAMKTAWLGTRVAYEHVEGATAPIFAQFDVSLDARYDDFLAMLGSAGDADLFDGSGVIGMHAIERILYANVIPQNVIDLESTLPGYAPASFPTTDAAAMEFKTELCQRLIDDAQALHDQWTPDVIDDGAVFQGLEGLMLEQQEKVNLAATGEQESRYAQVTLFDLRNNLDGTTKIYDFFQPWLFSKDGGSAIDGQIQSGFATLHALYASVAGDALPPVPADWSSDEPSPADLQTPFGMLWESVQVAVNAATPGTIVYEMYRAATLLGFPLPVGTED